MPTQTTVTGFKELEEALGKLGPMITGLKGYPKNALRNASRAAGKVALEAAKANAPVDTGRFRDAIGLKLLSLKYRDQATLRGNSKEYYYIGVNLGESRKDMKGAWYANPVIHRTEFGTDTMPARPFLRNAVNNNLAKLESTIVTKLRADLIKIANKVRAENVQALLKKGVKP